MVDLTNWRVDQLKRDLDDAVRSRTPERLRGALAGGAFVYGAGSFGRRVVKRLQELGIDCIGVIDRQAGHLTNDIEGVPIVHPDMLTPSMCAGRILVLGVFNRLLQNPLGRESFLFAVSVG